MQLAAQHLAEIVETVKKMEAADAGSEKRRFARFAVVARIEVMQGASKRVYTALTRDLSLEGVGLLQATPMTKGELGAFKRAVRTIDQSCKGGKASKSGSYRIALNLDGMLGLLRYKPDSPYKGTTVRAVVKQKASQLKDCSPEQSRRISREFGQS